MRIRVIQKDCRPLAPKQAGCGIDNGSKQGTQVSRRTKLAGNFQQLLKGRHPVTLVWRLLCHGSSLEGRVRSPPP